LLERWQLLLPKPNCATSRRIDTAAAAGTLRKLQAWQAAPSHASNDTSHLVRCLLFAHGLLIHAALGRHGCDDGGILGGLLVECLQSRLQQK
jgi:hypothetical protein